MRQWKKRLMLGLTISSILLSPIRGLEAYANNISSSSETADNPDSSDTVVVEPDLQEESFADETMTENSSDDSESIDEGTDSLDYILGRPMTEEEIQEQAAIIEEAQRHLGYVEDIDAPQNVKLYPGTSLVKGTLPNCYDSRAVNGKSYVTVAKNQVPYGTCWAFSSIACIESNIIRKGYNDSTIDLSESHLIYFSNYSAPDVLGNDYKDQMYYQGTLGYLDQGGNAKMAYLALANWKGAVSETYAPYENVKAEFEQSTSVAYLQDIVHLQGFYYIDLTDVEAVKGAIMEYGAVNISYYANHVPPYWNYNTAAYYCNEVKGTDHAVTIVGWDDNYSKDNFTTTPDSDGAWLVKNSWGTDFGDDGFFWLSYEDKSIYRMGTVFDAEPADNYDNNYQYDFVSGSGYYQYGTSRGEIASIFEAKANAGKKEVLKAVSVDLSYNANVRYSLQIYKNPSDLSDPTSGTALLSVPQTGETTLAGYYTIPLPRDIELDQGDMFSVVFSLETVSGDVLYIPIEMSNNGTFACVATSQEHQSYINWFGSSWGWQDISARGEGNLRIKAFTNNVQESSIACSGITLEQQNASIYVGKTLLLSASVLPDNATNKQILWETSDPEVAAVDQNGTVTGMKAGNATITARTMNGNHTADCIITVKEIPLDGYIGNINSELISFDLKKTDSGASYLTGEIVVVEWVDGKSTVPSEPPVMVFKSTDGTEEIEVFVTATGTNTYYFDRFIEGLNPNKEYVFEIASGDEKNYSDNRSMNVNLDTSPKMVPLKNLGKIGRQKISYHKDTGTGELRLFQRTSLYEGWINSELKKTELTTGPNGNYVSGEIVVVEWEDSISTVPFEPPVMTFESTDGKEKLEVFVTPTGTNTYYFDRSLGDMDTSKEYIFTITSGDSSNISPYKSMIVTTAAMKDKSGTLWESATQYVRYRTDPQTGELRIYAVNK